VNLVSADAFEDALTIAFVFSFVYNRSKCDFVVLLLLWRHLLS